MCLCAAFHEKIILFIVLSEPGAPRGVFLLCGRNVLPSRPGERGNNTRFPGFLLPSPMFKPLSHVAPPTWTFWCARKSAERAPPLNTPWNTTWALQRQTEDFRSDWFICSARQPQVLAGEIQQILKPLGLLACADGVLFNIWLGNAQIQSEIQFCVWAQGSLCTGKTVCLCMCVCECVSFEECAPG